MHTFPEYAAPGRQQVLDLVRTHPFAPVVSTDSGVPVATHLPVVAPPGGLSLEPGATLWSHMARDNPQWRTFAPGRPVLVVFSGADAYVSAALYERTPAVPTWNYSAVHVTARPRLLAEGEETMAVLVRTVEALEQLRPAPWDHATSMDRFRAIAHGVVAFTLEVVEVRATFKLSQDKPDELWQRVHDGLAGAPASRPVADDMAAVRSCPA